MSNLYGPAPGNLHPRLRSDYEQIQHNGCRVIDEGDVRFVGQSLAAYEIMNSERFTLVQSADPSKADQAMEQGVPFKNYSTGHVQYESSFARLYSPAEDHEADRKWWNTFALSYRYATNFNNSGLGDDRSRSAKVVVQFPFSGAEIPQPGESLAHGTPIEGVAKRFMAKESRTSLRVRPEFVLGILDLERRDFRLNPRFDIGSRQGLGKVLRWAVKDPVS